MIEPAKNLTAKLGTLALAVAAALVITGCQTNHHQFANPADAGNMAASTNSAHAESIILREGDQIKITFPGAAALNTAPQPILRDGTISLPVVGNVKAVGKTTDQLRDDLLKLYEGKIETKELLVEVASATFPIFVSGAVLKPAKITSDHPMSALEAIMECGGPDYAKANLKSVKVMRQDGTRVKTYEINVKNEMQNGEEQFYLQPGDMIYVKEKFTWF